MTAPSKVAYKSGNIVRVEIIKREEYEFKVAGPRGKPVVPNCSEGCGSILRQKCAWDLGGSCPRHELTQAYEEALRIWRSQHVAANVLDFYREEFPVVYRESESHSPGSVSSPFRTFDINSVQRAKFDWLETVHCYIQWMFPTDEVSQFNPDAPLVTTYVRRVFRENGELRRKLIRSLERILRFYGLEVIRPFGGPKWRVSEPWKGEIKDRPEVVLVTDKWLIPNQIANINAGHVENYRFEARASNWLRPGNHNLLRLTRILRSLTLLGLPVHALALLNTLEKIATERLDVITDTTLEFWRAAVNEPVGARRD